MFSRLRLRILTVNLIPILVLLLGILYLGQYEKGLIEAELKTLEHQSMLYAGAIAETAVRPQAIPDFSANERNRLGIPTEFEMVDILSKPITRRMVYRMGEMTAGRIRVYDIQDGLISDSHSLTGSNAKVQSEPLPPMFNQNLADIPKQFLGWLADHLPRLLTLPEYPKTLNQNTFPGIVETMSGEASSKAWATGNGNVILSAAAPIQNLKQVMGAVYITQDGGSIKDALRDVTINILSIFALTISVTVILSLYLAAGIANPLKKLARSAAAVREGKVIAEKIPDFSKRRDEIGDLSFALRDMTQALSDRIDSIEKFAADVAHELKNPLTSLKSAVETASIVSSDKDRKRLFEIIQHDVQRLNRLITDISSASRLDAELAREPLGRIDLKQLLTFIKENCEDTISRERRLGYARHVGITLSIETTGRDAIVLGIESRLGQVFSNLVDNAVSFSPEDGVVEIRARKSDSLWVIEILDSGPGIPENKLTTIFDRFYSERPDQERFGQHSGLGLSISKQIIEAHRGHIYAENKYNESGQKAGACFTVILHAA